MKTNDLSGLKLKDEDIVTILSNLLNNAIEACERVETERVIKIKLIDEDEMTLISVQNTSMEVKKDKEGNFITNKEKLYEHGIGLKNIQETVEKYGGSYLLKQKDGFFNFYILIPHKEKM